MITILSIATGIDNVRHTRRKLAVRAASRMGAAKREQTADHTAWAVHVRNAGLRMARAQTRPFGGSERARPKVGVGNPHASYR